MRAKHSARRIRAPGLELYHTEDLTGLNGCRTQRALIWAAALDHRRNARSGEIHEVIVTQEVTSAVQSDIYVFDELSRVELKGIAEPVVLYRAAARSH